MSLDNFKKAKASNYKEYIDAQVGPTLRNMFFEKYPQKQIHVLDGSMFQLSS